MEVTARLLMDCMGYHSPIAKQIQAAGDGHRRGRLIGHHRLSSTIGAATLGLFGRRGVGSRAGITVLVLTLNQL